jgi:acetyl-CoA C-acetyltransferase
MMPVRTADGVRFMATTEDEALVALMSDGDPLGVAIKVTPTEHGNRATLA